MKTDERVKQDVVAELNWELAVDAGKICVAVQEGVVTLTGHVSSYSEKWEAERAAQRVSTVKVVAAGMEVDLPESDKRSDLDIAHSAQSVLQCMTYLPMDCIKVVVEKGCITLSGEVDRDYHRQTAASAARRPIGVTDVSDQIVVNSGLSLQALQADIAQSITPSAKIEVSVEVKRVDPNPTAPLDATTQADQVDTLSCDPSGLRKVINRITVE